MKELPSPLEIKSRLKASFSQLAFVARARGEIQAILSGQDARRLLIVGPCSIHDISAAYEFAEQLAALKKEVEGDFFLVMRTYFEKARSALGWPGLLYDPLLDGSHDIEKGIELSRSLLLYLAECEIPAGTEFLGKPSALYLSDLISWGSIGARTSSSQTHRHMASLLPMPIGFKNSVDGSIESAICGHEVAKSPHPLFWINEEGKPIVLKTLGNPYAHVVLRGGDSGPNYQKSSIEKALMQINSLLVDCSHGNSSKNPLWQIAVFDNLIDQMIEGNGSIRGMMIESFLSMGSQKLSSSLIRGVSITDPCLDFASTKKLILHGALALQKGKKALL